MGEIEKESEFLKGSISQHDINMPKTFRMSRHHNAKNECFIIPTAPAKK